MEKSACGVHTSEKVNMKRIIKFIFGLALAGVFIGVVIFKGAEYFNTPDLREVSERPVVVTINSGENVKKISERLKKKDLIRSAGALILYSKLRGTGGSFKAGSYRIEHGEKMTVIHDILIQGHQQLYRVTIPEGWTIKQIGVLLEQEGITKADLFQKACQSSVILKKYAIPANTVEGFLYPDTYLMQKNFPAEKVVTFMIDSFFRKMDEVYPAYKTLSHEDFYRKIVLASIVEREYRLPEEAPLIAGVFYNRLEKGMSLGSCATIAYIITDIEGKSHPSRITYDDLDIKSPYNTYLNKGLPPSPIANPGEVALKASFFPENTKYMFFVLENTNDGKHKFTVTYQAHLNAKNLFIKTK